MKFVAMKHWTEIDTGRGSRSTERSFRFQSSRSCLSVFWRLSLAPKTACPADESLLCLCVSRTRHIAKNNWTVVPQVFSIASLPREAADDSGKLTVSFDCALVCDVADLIFSHYLLHLSANTTQTPETKPQKIFSTRLHNVNNGEQCGCVSE